MGKSMAEARAEKTDDAKAWKAADCLEAVARRIRNGEIAEPDKLVIWYTTPSDDETTTIKYFAAGVNHWEHLALLTLAQDAIISNWKD